MLQNTIYDGELSSVNDNIVTKIESRMQYKP